MSLKLFSQLQEYLKFGSPLVQHNSVAPSEDRVGNDCSKLPSTSRTVPPQAPAEASPSSLHSSLSSDDFLLSNNHSGLPNYDLINLPSALKNSVGTAENEGERSKSNKQVTFPEDDELVTHYFEVRQPFRKHSDEECKPFNIHETLKAYITACYRYKVAPSLKVEKQISTFDPTLKGRQEGFNLRGEKISYLQMESLEEIFKRVQFVSVDFEYSFLDDDAVVALADMLEYYDSCLRLNLSFNQHIGLRGWQALFRMLRKSPCLEDLNLRYTSLTERTVPFLARVLRTESSLLILHLENCSLSGRSLLLIVAALKVNTSVKEVYLAENNLGPNDAAHLFQLIVHTTSVQLLDIRNNMIQDAGLAHICDALRHDQCQKNNSLATLVLWNNRLTAAGMPQLARAMLENKTLQTLNLGCNPIGSEGAAILKDALIRNRALLRIGMQSTKLNCQGAIAIAECIADNPVLVRVDLRDNPEIRLAGLLALHLAMKINYNVTALNLDKSCTAISASKVKDYSEEFKRIYSEIQDFCQRNRVLQIEKQEQQRSVENGLADAAASTRHVDDDALLDHHDVMLSLTSHSVCTIDKTGTVEHGSVDAVDSSDFHSFNNGGDNQEECEIDAQGSSAVVISLDDGGDVLISDRESPPQFEFFGPAKMKRDMSLTCTDSLELYSERVYEIEKQKPTTPTVEEVDEQVEQAPEAFDDDDYASTSSFLQPIRVRTWSGSVLTEQQKEETPVTNAKSASDQSPPLKIAGRFRVSRTVSVDALTDGRSNAKKDGSGGETQRPTSLPIAWPVRGAGGVGRQGRFMVSKSPVDTPSASVSLRERKKEEQNSTFIQSDAEIEAGVRRIVRDLVNFCVYTVGDSPSGVGVQQAISGVQTGALKQGAPKDDEVIRLVVRDLVNFAVYENERA